MNIHDKITKCAGNLFLEKGTKQVTMDNIAQELGISKRTIYENFKDKNELLYTFLTETMISHKKACYEIIDNSQNVIDALFRFGEFNRKMAAKANPCFFEDLKKYHNDIFTQIKNNKNVRNYDITYTLLKRGINEGNFRKEIDIEIANLFIHYSLDFFKVVENENKFEHKKIWESVHLPYLRGICTNKGIDLINGITKEYENRDKQ